MTCVRVCPQHNRILAERGDELVCPVGRHTCSRWHVVDTEDVALRNVVVADAKLEEVREMSKLSNPKEPQAKTKQLAGARFVNEKGKRLVIRLLMVGEKRRVGWIVETPTGKKSGGKQQVRMRIGWTHESANDIDAKAAYADALKRAKLKGWVVDETFGRRGGFRGAGVAITEIPAADAA